MAKSHGVQQNNVYLMELFTCITVNQLQNLLETKGIEASTKSSEQRSLQSTRHEKSNIFYQNFY